ncbi:MAG: hypothetical protein ABWY18_10740 [Tardiphaga sp.]
MRSSIAALFAMLFSGQIASAEPVKARSHGGHLIEVRAGRDGQEQLVVDKKVRLTDRFITLDEFAVVDGIAIVAGEVSNGGNLCPGSTFILSLPDKRPARLEGPLETCGLVTRSVDRDRLTLDLNATPQSEGKRWIWTSAGLGEPKALPFEPKRDGGWEALRNRSMSHPADLLGYLDTTLPLDERLGDACDSYRRVTGGPGEASSRDGFWIATSCQAHACDVSALLLAVHPETKAIFVAIKGSSESLVVSPKVDEWPSAVRAEVAAFVKRWGERGQTAATPGAAVAAAKPDSAVMSPSAVPRGTWSYGRHPVLGLSAHVVVGDHAFGIACHPQPDPASTWVASQRMTPGLVPRATEPAGAVSVFIDPFRVAGGSIYKANGDFVEQVGGYCTVQLDGLRRSKAMNFIRTKTMALEWDGRRTTMTVEQEGRAVKLVTGKDMAAVKDPIVIPLAGARAAIDRLLKACPAISRMKDEDCTGGD